MGKPSFHVVDGDVGPIPAARAFAALDRTPFPGLNGHPLFGDFTRRLYRTIHPSGYPDRSFVVAGEIGPAVAVACTVGTNEVSSLGLPAVVALRRDLDVSVAAKALTVAFEHLDRIGANDGASLARVRGGEAGHFGPLDHICIARLAKPIAKMHAVVDLAGGEEAIRRGLRDSYRSLVNWGRKQMVMTYINGDNPDRAQFDAFPSLHSRIAGSGARGPDYWNVVWEEIARGDAELSLGRLADGSLVAGTLSVFTGGSAYYASGVYDRERFEKPIAHWPMFDALVRAAARGISRYDLGEVLPRGTASEKEVQIGFFKKGFTDRIVLWIEWHVSLTPPQSAST